MFDLDADENLSRLAPFRFIYFHFESNRIYNDSLTLYLSRRRLKFFCHVANRTNYLIPTESIHRNAITMVTESIAESTRLPRKPSDNCASENNQSVGDTFTSKIDNYIPKKKKK